MLELPKNIMVRDRATLFNLLIGLNGFTVCSGVLDAELNGENIIAKPLDSDCTEPLRHPTAHGFTLAAVSQATSCSM